MDKKALTIFCWALVLLLALGCVLYFVPWSTPIDLTLNATIFDQDGFEIGTTQITIRGKKLDYLFQKDRLDITIEPFDGWSNFILSEDAHTGKEGVIRNPIDGIYTVSLACFYGNDLTFCKLYFTDNFDHLVLYIDTDGGRYAYLASVGDDHTADKVIDHFQALNFNPLPSK